MRPRTTSERGYGREHQAERERVKRLVQAGAAVCARCGCSIRPGASWDLGHTDDRTGYRGPEHSRCNRAAGARRRHAKARARRAAQESAFGPEGKRVPTVWDVAPDPRMPPPPTASEFEIERAGWRRWA